MSINTIYLDDSVNNSKKTLKYKSFTDSKQKEIADNFLDNPKMKTIDKIQLALDIVWLEQTFWSIADWTNALISFFRAALSKEKDQRKRHIINAGISAVSIIPFADVIKILKLRKAPKIAKAYIKASKWVKNYAKVKKSSWTRFENDEYLDERIAA